MINRLLYIFIFSLLFSLKALATKQDSSIVQHHPTFSIGMDISQPIIYAFNNNLFGIQIVSDYRFNNNWYVAVETGYQSVITDNDYLSYTTKGGYMKAGFNYNVVKSARKTDNSIYIGSRLVTSFYNQNINNYNINNDYWGGSSDGNFDAGGSFSLGLEAILGVKLAVAKNIVMGWTVRCAFPLYNQQPEGFDNLYIPGMGYNSIPMFNFNYTVSYLFTTKIKPKSKRNK
jgi:hypothetical protein